MNIRNIIQDFNPSKKIMSWLLVAAIMGIGLSFTFGRKYTKSESKIDNIEKIVTENKHLIIKTNDRIDSLQVSVYKQFEDGYSKGISAMNTYQNSINDQLDFLIKHGDQDRELLKEALDLKRTSTKIEIDKVINKSNNIIEEETSTTKSVINIEDYKKVNNISKDELEEFKIKYSILRIEKNDDGTYNISYISKVN